MGLAGSTPALRWENFHRATPWANAIAGAPHRAGERRVAAAARVEAGRAVPACGGVRWRRRRRRVGVSRRDWRRHRRIAYGRRGIYDKLP
eukprot:SAG11_NODE_17313_length_522_cov_0.631206_1_plen_90_part_00